MSSFGYFGFYLALEMERLGFLQQLLTNLPRNRTAGVSSKRVSSNLTAALPYLTTRLGITGAAQRCVNWLASEQFDKWVSTELRPCEVFHSFSSFGLHSLRSARKRYGSLTIIERGSSHIEFQRDILRDEHRIWGLPDPDIDDRVIEKELAEYEEADYITVQSSFAEKTFTDRGIPAARLIKLPLGVDVELFRPVPKKDDVFRVLYAGSLSLRKGSIYLIRAIADLQLPNFEFVLNGHVPAELRDLLRPYSRHIKFVGSLPFNELRNLFSQASIFVLPTIEDGYAKVVSEAMACGLPVIATTNCGAPDVMSDGVEGFIVPIRDSNSIRDRIIQLYEDSDLRDRMGAAALIKARHSLSRSTYGVRAAEIYRGIARQRFTTNN